MTRREEEGNDCLGDTPHPEILRRPGCKGKRLLQDDIMIRKERESVASKGWRFLPRVERRSRGRQGFPPMNGLRIGRDSHVASLLRMG